MDLQASDAAQVSFSPPQGLKNQVVGLSRQKVLNWKASKEKIPSVPAKVGLSRQKVLKYRGLSSQVLLYLQK